MDLARLDFDRNIVFYAISAAMMPAIPHYLILIKQADLAQIRILLPVLNAHRSQIALFRTSY